MGCSMSNSLIRSPSPIHAPVEPSCYLVDEARRMVCSHFSRECCGVMDAIRKARNRCHLLGLASHIFIPTEVLVQSQLCRSFTRPFTH